MPNVEGLPPSEQVPEPLEDIETAEKFTSMWHERIRDATHSLEKDKRLENWRRWTQKASAKWERKDYKGDFIAVNKPYSIITSIVSQTYARNPRYAVRPRQEGTDEFAANQTHLVNYIVDEIALKREGKLATKQAVTIGHSWLKVFWQSIPVPVTVMETTVDTDPLSGMPIIGQSPKQVEVDMGKPRVRHVPAQNVRIDPDAKRVEDARWIAHRVVRPTKSIQADRTYINTENIRPTHTSAEDSTREMISRYEEKDRHLFTDSDRTVIWEIEDFENKEIIAVAEGHKVYLRREPDSYIGILEDTGMWVHVEHDEDPESPFGIGIMDVIETLADEKNLLRIRHLNHTKRALTKFLALESVQDKSLNDLTRGDDMAFAKVPTLDSIKALDMPNLPLDNRIAESNIDRDMAELSGSSDLQRGVSPQGTQTATEIAAIGSNERIRMSSRADKIEDAMRTVGRKLLKLMRAYMKTDQVVRIMGENGISGWKEFTPSEITGEYDVSVEYGSTVLRDEIERRQIDQNLYNLIAQDPLVNRLEIIKDIFRDFGKGNNIDKYLNMALVNREAFANALAQAVQTGNVDLALATLDAVIQSVMPPAKGPAVPMQGVPSARPMSQGSSIAAGPPRGGESPAGPLQTPGQIRAGFMGRENQPKL